MFRKVADHHYTASISTSGTIVTGMYDDGFEDLVDFRLSVANEAEARAILAARGYEEYDPNAALKAAGLVWDPRRGIYCRPAA